MKIDPRRAEAVLRAPGPFRAILLYGDDRGQIRGRAEQVTRDAAGSLDDPFRVATLERETHDRLAEEATALALTGGQRVVRVREAGDGITATLERILESKTSCLLVLEAPGLPAKARLRALADRHAAIAAIGCYPQEGRGLEATIRDVLGADRVAITEDAMAWVTSQLGADQALTQREVEKLVLYCGRNGTADLAAAQACIGDAASVSLEDALFSATAGDVAATDRALERAVEEGLAPIGLIRAALLHLQRLHRASLAVASGQDSDEVIRGMRPPLFYRRQTQFARALALWRPIDAAAVIAAAFAAEQTCKRTGSPAETIGVHTVLAIARRAAQARRVSRASAG
jgi:DNA polymerase-3 subunit delta